MNKLENFLLPKLPGYKSNNRFKWGEMYLGGGRGSDLSLKLERAEIYEGHDLLVFKLPYIFRLSEMNKKTAML